MQAKDQITIEFTQGKILYKQESSYNSIKRGGVSLDPMGEQSGISQISYHSCLTLESGERDPIYSLSHEGVHQGGYTGENVAQHIPRYR